jgi:hypothetical protein
MAGEEVDLECPDDVGAAVDGLQLTHTTNGRPQRSTAGDPMRDSLEGRPAGGDLPDPAADRAATDGAGTPQLPGLEMY